MPAASRFHQEGSGRVSRLEEAQGGKVGQGPGQRRGGRSVWAETRVRGGKGGEELGVGLRGRETAWEEEWCSPWWS